MKTKSNLFYLSLVLGLVLALGSIFIPAEIENYSISEANREPGGLSYQHFTHVQPKSGAFHLYQNSEPGGLFFSTQFNPVALTHGNSEPGGL